MRERYQTMGYDALDLGPDAFPACIERERGVWDGIIEKAELKLD